MSTPKFKLLCLENPLLDIQGKGYVEMPPVASSVLQNINIALTFSQR